MEDMAVKELIQKQVINQVFARAAKLAPFAVTFWDQSTREYGEGRPRFRLIINDAGVFDRLPESPEIAFGDAFMRGQIDVDGDPADMIAMGIALMRDNEKSGGGTWLVDTVKNLTNSAVHHLNRRPQDAQKEHVARHYDLSNDFFRQWLDESMTYSCAYFRSPSDTLEDAQRQKIDLVLRKLRLRAGETLLDIGSGWGGLVIRATEHYGAQATGITLSEEQEAESRARIQAQGLEDRATVRLAHYQTLAQEDSRYDKIASIGMIEHIGKAHLPDFAQAVETLLRPGGLALLHCITSPIEGPFNAWMEKHIFPGAYVPTVPELLGHLAAHNLRVLDVENLRPHYQMTVDRWSERFDRCVPQVRAQFGEEFARMWRLYLRGSSASFREGTSELHQILVSRGIPTDLPLTREDIYTLASP